MDVDTPQENGDAGRDHDEVTIRVNTKATKWDHRVISFDQVVSIAYDGNPPSGPNWVFDVDYRRGPQANPEGILESGKSVEVRDGMLFDVTGTDNS